MSVAMVFAFASIVIAMVAISTMWRSGSTAQAAVRFEVRLAEDQAAAGLDAARVPKSNRVIYLHRDAIVTNADIASSRVVPGATPSEFWIDVRLNDAGAQKMREATTNHIGRPVAILIDGDVVAVPTVKSPISAAAMISGDFTRADADRIVNGMTITP
jgi:preprotein translocase subunit SecD